jgi:hypothetical protein
MSAKVGSLRARYFYWQMQWSFTMTSPRASDSRKVRQRQINQSIAEVTRQLIELVRERIDAGGRVSSSSIARIAIDHRFIGVSFVDYPEEFLDLVEWRQR